MNRGGKVQSIQQKLLNLSRQRQIDYNIIMIWYALERLLYRLGRSQYSERFILKGAMLFSVWFQEPFRPTKDIDFLCYGDSSEAALKAVFTKIVNTESEEDGLSFIAEDIDVRPIREELEYGGQRITLPVRFGNARLRLQIDIGFGDAVTPSPQKVHYPTLLEMAAPEILAYSKETVTAEKFHAITVLGLTNSRMKDYYDLWILSNQYEFEGNLLARAIHATFERRKTKLPSGMPLALTEEFYKDSMVLARWNAFVGKTELTVVEQNLENVIRHLQVFFGEILNALADHNEFNCRWDKISWKEK